MRISRLQCAIRSPVSSSAFLTVGTAFSPGDFGFVAGTIVWLPAAGRDVHGPRRCL